jgi:hypothetical protein
VSACPHALAAAADHPPTAPRAARLAKFKREQRIVEYLNRGVSVAEIAARVGVGEKRLRAIIREILARRMPHPPEEFVAIQMSRLSEALLVAFSAMSPSNLKAVDQVVKIVRELDRYGGAFAAEWARPAASRLDAPTDADVAFAKAWLGDAELAEDRGDGPEISLQDLERIDSAPGNIADTEARADAPAELAASLDPVPSRTSEAWSTANVATPVDDGRPGNPLQGSEKIESAPETRADVEARADAPAEFAASPAPVPSPAIEAQPIASVVAPASDARPENRPQPLETMDSAPGNGWLPGAPFGAGHAFVSRAFPNPPCPEFVRVRAKPNGLAA